MSTRRTAPAPSEDRNTLTYSGQTTAAFAAAPAGEDRNQKEESNTEYHLTLR